MICINLNFAQLYTRNTKHVHTGKERKRASVRRDARGAGETPRNMEKRKKRKTRRKKNNKKKKIDENGTRFDKEHKEYMRIGVDTVNTTGIKQNDDCSINGFPKHTTNCGNGHGKQYTRTSSSNNVQSTSIKSRTKTRFAVCGLKTEKTQKQKKTQNIFQFSACLPQKSKKKTKTHDSFVTNKFLGDLFFLFALCCVGFIVWLVVVVGCVVVVLLFVW